MKIQFSFILIFTLLVISGCNHLNKSPLNENPPDYIKSVNVYKEGSEGIMIYFILADASGAMTTSDGSVTLTIVPEDHDCWANYGDLYTMSYNVKKTNFQKAKVGVGAFEHEVILCSIGRIPYSSFQLYYLPEEVRTGEVNIEFQRPDGKILKGKSVIFF